MKIALFMLLVLVPALASQETEHNVPAGQAVVLSPKLTAKHFSVPEHQAFGEFLLMFMDTLERSLWAVKISQAWPVTVTLECESDRHSEDKVEIAVRGSYLVAFRAKKISLQRAALEAKLVAKHIVLQEHPEAEQKPRKTLPALVRTTKSSSKVRIVARETGVQLYPHPEFYILAEAFKITLTGLAKDITEEWEVYVELDCAGKAHPKDALIIQAHLKQFDARFTDLLVLDPAQAKQTGEIRAKIFHQLILEVERRIKAGAAKHRKLAFQHGSTQKVEPSFIYLKMKNF